MLDAPEDVFVCHQCIFATCVQCLIAWSKRTYTATICHRYHCYRFIIVSSARTLFCWMYNDELMCFVCFQMHGWWKCSIRIASVILQTYAAPPCGPRSAGTCHTSKICKTLVRNSTKDPEAHKPHCNYILVQNISYWETYAILHLD